MKLYFVHPEFWCSFLFLWALQDMTVGNQDICEVEKDKHIVTEEHDNFTCCLYPTNIVNCSWSFQDLEREAQLSVYISICNDETIIPSLSQSSNERVGSRSLTVQQHDMLYVILQFNKTLHNKCTFSTYTYEKDLIEVLSPPLNISATVKDGSLFVTWSPPLTSSRSECLEYQLDLGDEETPKDFHNELSYTEPNVDLTCTYRVRVRTRKHSDCLGSVQWSEWSPIVTVEKSAYILNTLLIISISLGIPMILLAVMLLVHHQRVSELLFPPIPCPPPKYKHFLEKNETFMFSHPVPSPAPEEEITKVDDTD